VRRRLNGASAAEAEDDDDVDDIQDKPHTVDKALKTYNNEDHSVAIDNPVADFIHRGPYLYVLGVEQLGDGEALLVHVDLDELPHLQLRQVDVHSLLHTKQHNTRVRRSDLDADV
jgi:hypothetical protein